MLYSSEWNLLRKLMQLQRGNVCFDLRLIDAETLSALVTLENCGYIQQRQMGSGHVTHKGKMALRREEARRQQLEEQRIHKGTVQREEYM